MRQFARSYAGSSALSGGSGGCGSCGGLGRGSVPEMSSSHSVSIKWRHPYVSETFSPFSPFKDKIAYFVTLSPAIALPYVHNLFIHLPGIEKPSNIKGGWTNFYSPTAGILRGDFLGYAGPLMISLRDVVNVLSPGSHSHYWTDAKVMEDISKLIYLSKKPIYIP